MRRVSLCLLLVSLCTTARAQGTSVSDDSLESLVGTRIYTASKKAEDPDRSPSAIYVITADDIKQMGVRHVADALVTVPGLQVAKISSNKWMVAARGFGEQFSNKLLVLVDGRPVYTTLFSGVLWDAEDIPIVDVKQIEVIRGPGATLWGSNAVNGVINIITKSAQERLGTHVSTTTGFTDTGKNQTILEMQHGQLVPELGGSASTTVRVNRDPSYESVRHTPGFNDSWQAGTADFRYDKTPNPKDSLSIEGSIQADDANQTYTFPQLTAPFKFTEQGKEESRNASLQGTWTQAQADDAQVTVHSYLSYTDWQYVHFNPQFVNLGLEGQYDFKLMNDWESVIGSGYKLSSDYIESGPYLIYDPKKFTAQFADIFFQTKIPLIKNNLDLTLGSKAESNTYDDFELSPSAKLAWTPSHFVMLWSSYSRAYRSPSRGTKSLTTLAAGTPGGYVGLIPNEDFKSEALDAYEAGIRVNPLKGVHVDTSVFYNTYQQLRTFIPGPAVGDIAVGKYLTNEGAAQTRGIEVSATYQTSPKLRMTGGFSHEDLSFTLDPGASDTAFASGAQKWPHNMWNAHMAYQIMEDVTFNLSGYYTSSMLASSVPGYTKVNTNISWTPMEGEEVVLGVDNLTDNLHQEYPAQLFGEPEEVPRLFYLTLKAAF